MTHGFSFWKICVLLWNLRVISKIIIVWPLVCKTHKLNVQAGCWNICRQCLDYHNAIKEPWSKLQVSKIAQQYYWISSPQDGMHDIHRGECFFIHSPSVKVLMHRDGTVCPAWDAISRFPCRNLISVATPLHRGMQSEVQSFSSNTRGGPKSTFGHSQGRNPVDD